MAARTARPARSLTRRGPGEWQTSWAGRAGARRQRSIDPDLPLDRRAVGGGEAPRLEGAGQDARRHDLDTGRCREIPPHRSPDDDGGGADVGVDLRALADEHPPGDLDLALEL